jgi:hypothetical protein
MSEATEQARTVLTAEGQAHVDQQVGHIGTYIKKVVHHHTTYQDSAQSPEKTFEAACEYLAGGAASKAAEMIEEAQAHGFQSAKVAYYWQVALLAGRPFDHLSLIDLDRLEQAHCMARDADADGWTAAVEVIEELLECFSLQVQTGDDDDTYRFDRAFARYERLPDERREEMGRHLALLFSGGLQNRLDRERRRQIEQHRMGCDRRHRAPKFFEPDPAEPRLRHAAGPQIGPGHWVALAAGLVAFALGSATLLWRSSQSAPLKTSVLGVALAAGCLGVALVGPGILHRRAMSNRRENRRWLQVIISTEDVEVRTTDLDKLIHQRVTEVAPTDHEERTRFWEAADPELTVLSDALHGLYASGEAEVVEPPQRIDWLVRWHVHRLFEAWTSGALRPDADPRRWATREEALVLAVAAGTVAGATGLLTITIARWSLAAIGSMLGGLFLLVSGVVGLLVGATVYSERRRFREEAAGNRRLLDEERAAWQHEQARLSDRPRDAEMAEWLDYDKDHVRLSAMKDWGLRNGNVIAHVVLTEPQPESASARIVGGPRRYSHYIVRLFLLTDNGVRTLDVHLDFATGAENKQQRHAFRYDAIASARIEEPTVRRHGRRQVATPEGGGPKGVSRPIRRQTLHLTLLSGERFDINVDYEGLLADEDRFDNDKLLTLEMETSGAVSTLRTLESVAGEGREWISRERERNRRTASSYQRPADPTAATADDQ